MSSNELSGWIADTLGHAPGDVALFARALTHGSHGEPDYERLEFLGDAILGLVICELLFRQFPQYLEGDLTKIKSIVVSRQTCAPISGATKIRTSSLSTRNKHSWP